MIIPVRPGRDLARLIEVAAYHTKLKSVGYNPAKELDDRLIARMTAPPQGGHAPKPIEPGKKVLSRLRIRGS